MGNLNGGTSNLIRAAARGKAGRAPTQSRILIATAVVGLCAIMGLSFAYYLLELTHQTDTQQVGKNVLARLSVTQSGMWVNGIVVLHPAIDQGEGGSSIGDRVIALEGLHERLGHAVALGAFDRVAKALRDAVDHHVADHLTRCRPSWRPN